jgi:hypothetical protein
MKRSEIHWLSRRIPYSLDREVVMLILTSTAIRTMSTLDTMTMQVHQNVTNKNSTKDLVTNEISKKICNNRISVK